MRNDLQRHKKSDGIKWFAMFLAVILLAVAVTAAITSGFKDWNPYGWLDKKETVTPDENEKPVVDENGNELESGVVHEMPARMSFRSAASLSAESYSQVTLRATVKPSSATNKTVDWRVEFVNADSSWAAGKTVTNYVTVTPETDGSETATVQCLQPFSEQIRVVVTSRSNELATASCTVDFVKRVENFSLKFYADENYTGSPNYTINSSDGSVRFLKQGKNLADSQAWRVENLQKSAGTIDDTYNYLLTFEFNSSVLSAFDSLGIPRGTGSTLLYPSGGRISKSIYSLSNVYLHMVKLESGEFGDESNAFIVLGHGMKLGGYFYQNPISTWGRIKLKATGTYGGFEKSIPFSYDPSCFEIYASSIELNDSEITI